MSIIIAKGEQITKCANNTSTSNQMFTFGKGNRYSYHKKPISNNLYNHPSSFETSIKNKKGFSEAFQEKKYRYRIVIKKNLQIHALMRIQYAEKILLIEEMIKQPHGKYVAILAIEF